MKHFILMTIITLFIGCGSSPSSKVSDTPYVPEKQQTPNSAEDIFTIGDDQNVLEGSSVKISASILDNSKEFTKFTWTENGKVVSTDEEFTADNLSAGEHHISLEVVDQDGKIYEDTVVVIIKKELSSNKPPVAKSLNFVLKEDEQFLGSLGGSDEDGDELSYLFVSFPQHGRLSGSAANLRYTPDANYNGSDSFVYKTNDGTIDSQYATVSINIEAVNDVPTATAQTVTLFENSSKNITLTGTDIENDNLTFTVIINPVHGVFDGTIYTPNLNYNGTDSFTFIAQDSNDSVPATIDIMINAVNDIPEFTNNVINIYTHEDNSTVEGVFTAIDADGDAYRFTTESNLTGFRLNENGSYDLNLTSDFYQSLNVDDNITKTVLITLTDDLNGSSEQNLTIVIVGKNDKPIAHDFVKNADEDSDISWDISSYIEDIDNNATFTLVEANITKGAVSIDSNGTIFFSPIGCFDELNATSSEYVTITYKIQDEHNASSEANLTVMVIGKNDVPIIASIETISVGENDTGSGRIYFNDVDNTNASLTFESNSTFINIDNNGTYTFDTSDSYNYISGDVNESITVMITISDGGDINATQEITITIIGENDTPIINSIADRTVSEDDGIINGTIIATDPDDNNLSFSAPFVTNFSINSNGNYTFNPMNYQNLAEGAEENLTIPISVSDGILSDTQNLIITITGVNDTPVASAGMDVTITEGQLVTFNASGSSDAEGSIVTYEWKEGVTVLADNNVSFIKSGFAVGIHNITLTVTDNFGLSSTDIVTITVNSLLASTFTPHTVTTNAKNSEWLEMVDLDQDGDLDILSASTGNNGAEVAWYENHGDNTFSQSIITANVNNPESIKAVDIDSDGDLDIYYTTYTDGASLMQCINDGSQNFTCNPITNATNGLAFIKLVNFDTQNDNLIDIITASWDNNKIEWLKNSGDGNFTGPHMIDYQNTDKVISIDTADFNKDGKIDIIAAHNGSNRIDWYAYNTLDNGDFVHHFVANINGVYSVDVADIDSDGYDDIIASSNVDGKVYWYKSTQSTSPTFGTALEIATLTNVYYASGVDMDGDGDIDILSASSESGGKIAWYENTGSDTNFPEHIIASNVDDIIRVFPTDIDNDGNMDVIAGDKVGNVIVYENNATTAITLLPKTGDMNDGDYGSIVNFTRDGSSEIVTDNLTNLMWADDNTATASISYWSNAETTCNNMTTGTFTDWRIPSTHELYYLLDRSQSPKIDSTFTNIAIDDGYWVNEYSSGSMFSGDYGWVDFSSAESTITSIMSLPEKHIRCIRGKSIEFNLIRDDTTSLVKDYKHNLMWDDTIASKDITNTWSNAVSICSSSTIGGYSDWRLANINELFSISTISGVDISFNKAFSNKNAMVYWSSTKDSNSDIYALDFSATFDDKIITTPTSSLSFTCVRNIE